MATRILKMQAAFLALAALTLAGCSTGQDVAAAKAGVEHFRSQMAQGQYAEIYAQSDPEMKKSAKEAELIKLLRAVTARLGKYQSAKQVGWHVNYGTGGASITLAYQTTYERGVATEQFIFRVKNGTAVLVGYHINSNALITNSSEAV